MMLQRNPKLLRRESPKRKKAQLDAEEVVAVEAVVVAVVVVEVEVVVDAKNKKNNNNEWVYYSCRSFAINALANSSLRFRAL